MVHKTEKFHEAVQKEIILTIEFSIFRLQLWPFSLNVLTITQKLYSIMGYFLPILLEISHYHGINSFSRYMYGIKHKI